MTIVEMNQEFMALTQIWDQQVPLEEKLVNLCEFFKVDSIAKVPFWTLYRTIKRLISH